MYLFRKDLDSSIDVFLTAASSLLLPPPGLLLILKYHMVIAVLPFFCNKPHTETRLKPLSLFFSTRKSYAIGIQYLSHTCPALFPDFLTESS